MRLLVTTHWPDIRQQYVFAVYRTSSSQRLDTGCLQPPHGMPCPTNKLFQHELHSSVLFHKSFLINSANINGKIYVGDRQKADNITRIYVLKRKTQVTNLTSFAARTYITKINRTPSFVSCPLSQVWWRNCFLLFSYCEKNGGNAIKKWDIHAVWGIICRRCTFCVHFTFYTMPVVLSVK